MSRNGRAEGTRTAIDIAALQARREGAPGALTEAEEEEKNEGKKERLRLCSVCGEAPSLSSRLKTKGHLYNDTVRVIINGVYTGSLGRPLDASRTDENSLVY